MRIFPCSNSFMIAGVVATTLVSDAMSKIVSTVITSRAGTTARSPYAFRYTTCPLCPMISTPPGIMPSRIAVCIAPSSARDMAGSFLPARAQAHRQPQELQGGQH